MAMILHRAREDELLVKLHRMLRDERRKRAPDRAVIAEFKRVLVALARQWRARPKPGNGRGSR
jgi:hypothetical protein